MLRVFVKSLQLHVRLLAAAGVALVALAVLPGWLGTGVRLATAWNVGGALYLVLAFHLMSTCDTGHIQRRARIEDEARLTFLALILLAVLSSLVAVFDLIGDARSLQGGARSIHIGLAAVTVIVSWLVLQVIFTLHYAHDFYGSPEPGAARGLQFPNEDAPDYWDFFYFTTSIGATSQTSDVAVTSKSMRRLVAFQSVLSFIFNTTIVAVAINLASGLL